MNDQPWSEVLSLCSELELLFKEAAPGPNGVALLKVQNLCARLIGANPYITMKAGEISRLAARFFSAQHHKHTPRGADGLMHLMRYSLLARIRDEANGKLLKKD